MAINVGIQRIASARARRISDYFSIVDLHCKRDDHLSTPHEVTLYIEGPGHEDAAARIAALINEQVIRRDTPDRPTADEIEDEFQRFVAENDGPQYEAAYKEEATREALAWDKIYILIM